MLLRHYATLIADAATYADAASAVATALLLTLIRCCFTMPYMLLMLYYASIRALPCYAAFVRCLRYVAIIFHMLTAAMLLR